MVIYLYFTSLEKKIPNSNIFILDEINVNTAFTTTCPKDSEIVVFRKEEWFKVFIHETFHAYGLDFARSEVSEFKLKIKSLFPINSDFDVYEAYTETWARIINCAFSSFNALGVDKNQNEFLSNLSFCLEIERMFALYQSIKMLGFMGLRYGDIHKKENGYLYKENTHVFAYYIMTAIFLNDQQGFMLWCKKNNTSLLKFKSTPESFDSFATYITSVYDCISLLNGLAQMGTFNKRVSKGNNKELMLTTRMSIIHTI